MIQTSEVKEKLAEWREKAKEGSLTPEEMREAIELIREGRISACFASAAGRAKAAPTVLPSAEELLRLITGVQDEQGII